MAFLCRNGCCRCRRRSLLYKKVFLQEYLKENGVGNRFFSRHGLSLRTKTRQGQKPPPAMEKEARKFWQEVQQIRRELGVSKIYNADQSEICFEYLLKQTIIRKGAKTIWVRCGGKDKERLTGMFLADSTSKQCDSFFVVKTEPSKLPERAAYNYIAQHGFGDKL
ncbi:DNA binding [Phytophthora oleae]|uniref:DNA binding n=1 Tax=Phytophthora oleae TaxID=2107226 RepID=A0ABD3FCK1_9STRA